MDIAKIRIFMKLSIWTKNKNKHVVLKTSEV